MFDFYRLLPPYWLQNDPTSKEWDAALNKALDSGQIKKLSSHTVDVGPYTVWIENWPYGYGRPRPNGVMVNAMPTVKTRKRLRKAIVAAVIQEGGAA